MMVRRLSLLVPLWVSSFAVCLPASASPRPETEAGGTAEQVSEQLQDRQDRQVELVGRLEERYPEFFPQDGSERGSGRSSSDSSIRVATRIDGSTSKSSSPPQASPSSGAKPSSGKVVPYQPLVLGSFFGDADASTPSPRVDFPILPEAVRSSPPPSLPRPRSDSSSNSKPVNTSVTSKPVPTSTASPESTSSNSVSSSSQGSTDRPADALLNFSDGPFPSTKDLVSGDPDAWYKSKVVSDLLGRSPNDQERLLFENEVTSKVERSFQNSGLDVDLTTNLADPAAHTLSIVSNALAKDNAKAIGIADIGGDGFTFIDNFETEAISSIDDLETALANNISHELMHAFGVDFHDESGESIDSGVIPWNLLTSDGLSFSDEAKDLLASAEFQARWDDLLASGSHQLPDRAHGFGCSCHPAGLHATPEPTTLVMWGLTLAGAVWSGRRWRQARVA